MRLSSRLLVSAVSPAETSVNRPVTLPSVLLVEEHDEMRCALRDWLLTSFPPSRLREARSMDEALRLAEQAQLDLVLINLELPGPNGIEATRMLRRRYPGCRVVRSSPSASCAARFIRSWRA